MDLNLKELEASYTGAGFTKKQAARMVNDKVNQLLWSQNLPTRDYVDQKMEHVDQKIDNLRNFLLAAIVAGTAVVTVVVTYVN